MWNTSGLQGPALHLVEGDRDAANWLAKLAVLKSLLVDSGGCLPGFPLVLWLPAGAHAASESVCWPSPRIGFVHAVLDGTLPV